MRYRHLLILLGLILIAIGLVERGWSLPAVWLGGDFLVLGIAHARGAHGVFGKRQDGTLPLWSWFVFLPLLVYISVVWHVIRFLSREPALNTVTKGLTIGRRLMPNEVEGEFENYVDLTAEFAEPASIRQFPGYFFFRFSMGLHLIQSRCAARSEAFDPARRLFTVPRATAGWACSLWRSCPNQELSPAWMKAYPFFERFAQEFI